MKDLHKILGVSEDADADAIKKAYRKLAKQFHPDVTGNDKKKTERFKEINEAYDVLSDKEKRAAYLRLKNAPVRSDGMPEGFDPEMFARTFGGGRGAASSSTAAAVSTSTMSSPACSVARRGAVAARRGGGGHPVPRRRAGPTCRGAWK